MVCCPCSLQLDMFDSARTLKQFRGKYMAVFGDSTLQENIYDLMILLSGISRDNPAMTRFMNRTIWLPWYVFPSFTRHTAKTKHYILMHDSHTPDRTSLKSSQNLRPFTIVASSRQIMAMHANVLDAVACIESPRNCCKSYFHCMNLQLRSSAAAARPHVSGIRWYRIVVVSRQNILLLSCTSLAMLDT